MICDLGALATRVTTIFGRNDEMKEMRMMTLAILCVIAPQRADKGAKREGSQTILHAVCSI